MSLDNTTPNRLPAFLALIAAASIWGATAAIMKFTLITVPPFTLALIRFGCAAILLYPLVFGKLAIQVKDLPTIFFAGLSGIGIHIAFFFWGLKLTTALNAGIIIASTPLFTLLFAHFFLNERLKKNFMVASLFGIAGIGLIIGKDFGSNGISLSPLGDLFILLAIISFVTYETITKRLFATYKPTVITWYAFVIGACFFFPFALYESLTLPNWTTNISTQVMLGILYGILFSSFAAYNLWEWGLSKVSESRVGFFFYLDPVVSTIAAVAILGEKITLAFILGSVLIFLGLILAEGHLPYHHLHKPANGPR